MTILSRAPELSNLHSSPVLSALAAELTGITDDDPGRGILDPSMWWCRWRTYPSATNEPRPRFSNDSSS